LLVPGPGVPRKPQNQHLNTAGLTGCIQSNFKQTLRYHSKRVSFVLI
jgi:hypothetical protein